MHTSSKIPDSYGYQLEGTATEHSLLSWLTGKQSSPLVEEGPDAEAGTGEETTGDEAKG